MKLRIAFHWRLLALIAAAGGAVFLGQSCMRRAESPESALNASEVGTVQTVVRVFRKVIGRDPSASEIQALKTLAYPDMVKKLLSSQQFDTEGYFNLHRERLLLNREGTPAWVKNSYNDYCALKLELAERAAEDRTKDYWEILKYRERWLPIADFGMNNCFFGTDVATLIEMQDTPSGGNAQQLTPKQKLAKRCVRDLPFSFPAAEGEDPEAKFKAFVDKLRALSDDQKKGSLLAVPEGEQLFVRFVKQNVFSEFVDFPEGTTQPKDMQIELVKQDGKPVMLQEIGKTANQQCRFAGVDPVNYQTPKGPFDDGGFQDGFDPGNPPVFFPEPVFAEPVGEPAEPLIVPEGQLENVGAAGAGAGDGSGTGSGEASGAAFADEPTDPAAEGSLFIKVKMPPGTQGVHGSPYWLSRHPSKPKNKNLNRARVTYFSYFCSDINPDAANFVGAPVTEFPEKLRPYFAPDDNHVKGSQNCFNCHTKVQPLANFYGLSSWGTRYDTGGGDDDFGGFFSGWPQFLPDQAPFDRPGGIYDGQNFLAVEGSSRGMEGLANVLTKYQPVKRCIAESTWASLVGREFPFFDEERAAATKAFQADGQPASLSKLLSHLMLDNARGKAYFTKGEVEMAKIKPNLEFVCPETLTEEVTASAMKTTSGVCVTCHQGEFIDDDKKFNFDNYFTQGNDDDSPEARGRLWQQLYCKIKTEKMPPAGAGITLDKATRGALWCFFEKSRNAAADAGTIPATFKGKTCPGVPAPAQAVNQDLGAPHEIGNAPGGH